MADLYNSDEELMATAFDLNENDDSPTRYLKSVREEYKKLPNIFFNNISHETKSEKKDHSFGLISERIQQLSKRKELVKTTEAFNTFLMKRFLFLKEEISKNKCEKGENQSLLFEWKTFLNNFLDNSQTHISPTISLITSIDSRDSIKILDWINDNFEEGYIGTSERQTLWIFSLFACIEKPLLDSDISLMNQLIKHMYSSLELLAKEGIENRFDILSVILIIELYFGQNFIFYLLITEAKWMQIH